MAAGLSLITAGIVHWNTVSPDRAVQQLRAQGTTAPHDLPAHVAPLGLEHIGLTGDYVWTAPDPAAPFRPLREVRATFPPLAGRRTILNKSCGDSCYPGSLVTRHPARQRGRR